MEITHQEMIEVLAQVPLFSDLSPFEFKRFVRLFQPVALQENDIVFGIDDSSDAAYVIFDGHISLFTEPDEEIVPFATMKTGDIFGEEALLFDDPRDYSAIAVTDAVLLRLDLDNFLLMLDNLPNAEKLLDVSISSRKLSVEVISAWLQDDEYVHVMTRRHPAILFFKIIRPCLAGLFVIILSILLQWVWLPPGRFLGWVTLFIGLPLCALWLVWSYADWRNDYFIVTNKRVVWIEKLALIRESRQEAPMRTIMSVGVSRTRLGSLLGFGDVVVSTYVGMIRLQEIAEPEITAKLIEVYWKQSNNINRRQEAQLMERKLQEKLDLPGDEMSNQDVNYALHTISTGQNKGPGFPRSKFSNFFNLRYEQEGAIIFRKHWFILLKHSWLPLMLMLVVIIVGLTRLSGKLDFLSLTPAMITVMIFFLAIFLWLLYVIEDWRNDVFMVTIDQVVDLDRKPLGKVRRRSAPLENILSIEYERRGLWGYLFNYGTVYIDIGATKLSFDHVYNPSKVQEDVFFKMGERVEQKRQREIEAERERVSDWIASYHRRVGNDNRSNASIPGREN